MGRYVAYEQEVSFRWKTVDGRHEYNAVTGSNILTRERVECHVHGTRSVAKTEHAIEMTREYAANDSEVNTV